MNRFLFITLFGLLTGLPLLAVNDTAPSRYTLVGLARCEGISYASLVDKQTGEILLLRTGKSEHGLTLASVKGGSDEDIPSAIVQKNGQSLTFYFHAPSPSATSPSVEPGTNISTPPGVNPAYAGQLTPPAGTSLPLVFRFVDPAKLELSDDQKAILSRLRQQFVDAIGGNSGGGDKRGSTANSLATNTTANISNAITPVGGSSPNPAEQNTSESTQADNWRAAQQESDALFKMQFGYDAFNSYQMAFSHQSTRK